MPNWCECDLKVIGPADKVQEFKLALKCPDDDSVFKINNIIPTPASLADAQADSKEIVFDIVYGSEEQFAMIKTLYEFEGDDRVAALDKFMALQPEGNREAIKEALIIYKSNHDLYGHKTWYTWRIHHWGTKWDTSESSIFSEKSGPDDQVCLFYTFNTAWSPPVEAIQIMSSRFSFLTFKMRYFECGMGFKGYAKFKDGEVLADKRGGYSGHRGG